MTLTELVGEIRQIHHEQSTKKEEGQKTGSSDQASLRDFCQKHPELYEPLSDLVLSEPERQLLLHGSADAYVRKAKEALRRNDLPLARTSFEMAARIEMFLGCEPLVRDYLILADEICTDKKHHEMHAIVLKNLETVMGIASSYYKSNEGGHPDNLGYGQPIIKPRNP